MKIKFDDFLNEYAKNDLFFSKEGKRIYQKIVKNIDTIEFTPTDENDFVEDSKGGKRMLYGVRFCLDVIDKKYDADVLLVNTLNIAETPFFDSDSSTFVFFIISQVNNKESFENNSYMARIRFKSWVDENVFVHEFTHYLDRLRYKSTYKFKNHETDDEYYNSPVEYNAFYSEIVREIIKNKKKLMGLSFNEFYKKVTKYGSQSFINSMSTVTEKRLKNRLYKLYVEL